MDHGDGLQLWLHTLDEGHGDLRLSAKGQLGRYTSIGSALRVRGPCFGKVQLASDGYIVIAPDAMQGYGDLPVGHLSEASKVLPRYANTVLALLRQAYLVQDYVQGIGRQSTFLSIVLYADTSSLDPGERADLQFSARNATRRPALAAATVAAS